MWRHFNIDIFPYAIRQKTSTNLRSSPCCWSKEPCIVTFICVHSQKLSWYNNSGVAKKVVGNCVGSARQEYQPLTRKLWWIFPIALIFNRFQAVPVASARCLSCLCLLLLWRSTANADWQEILQALLSFVSQLLSKVIRSAHYLATLLNFVNKKFNNTVCI